MTRIDMYKGTVWVERQIHGSRYRVCVIADNSKLAMVNERTNVIDPYNFSVEMLERYIAKHDLVRVKP